MGNVGGTKWGAEPPVLFTLPPEVPRRRFVRPAAGPFSGALASLAARLAWINRGARWFYETRDGLYVQIDMLWACNGTIATHEGSPYPLGRLRTSALCGRSQSPCGWGFPGHCASVPGFSDASRRVWTGQPRLPLFF